MTLHVSLDFKVSIQYLAKDCEVYMCHNYITIG